MSFGSETVPIMEKYLDKGLIKQLEIIQRRSIRAILDAPFCVANEIVELELGFNKLQ